MITEEGWRSKVKHVYVHNDSDYNLNVCVCVLGFLCHVGTCSVLIGWASERLWAMVMLMRLVAAQRVLPSGCRGYCGGGSEGTVQ